MQIDDRRFTMVTPNRRWEKEESVGSPKWTTEHSHRSVTVTLWILHYDSIRLCFLLLTQPILIGLYRFTFLILHRIVIRISRVVMMRDGNLPWSQQSFDHVQDGFGGKAKFASPWSGFLLCRSADHWMTVSGSLKRLLSLDMRSCVSSRRRCI